MQLRGFVAACLLSFAASIGVSGAGVTVITHGFNSDIDDWVLAMAAAVTQYPQAANADAVCYEIYFEETSAGVFAPRQRKLAGGNPLQSKSGEIIIKLNWSQLAGTLSGVTYSTTEVAPAVASTLTSRSFLPDLNGRALAELPLHFIGHSRGASLLFEVARLLGAQGIWIDHVTSIDPHPLNNDYDDSLFTTVVDAPAVPYKNVLFADNYYQVNSSFLGLDPSGQYVPGAYNRRLTVTSGGYGGIAPNHSNTHLWYHGTIDHETPASDGAATITESQRDAWWTEPEAMGAEAGYFFSRAGEGDRLSTDAPNGGTNQVVNGFNQWFDLGAGEEPNRVELPANTGAWPNALTIHVDPAPAGGGVPRVALQYQAGGAGLSPVFVAIFADPDSNPYSNNAFALSTRELPATGANAVGSASFELAAVGQLQPGVYSIGAVIQTGANSRYLYARNSITVSDALDIESAHLIGTNFELTVRGSAGQTVVLQESSDLRTWTPVATNTLSSSTWTYSAPLESDEGIKAYRAVSGL